MRDAEENLPPFTVRRSARARHARISVTPRHGVVVVIPDALSGLDPRAIVRERAEWIAQAQAEFSAQREALTADPAALLPVSVRFLATAEQWGVEYRPTTSCRVSVRSCERGIVVSGATHDAEKCLAALRRWLHARAIERLLPRLAELAASHSLAYAGAGIRGQHGRWGGCSVRGFITLNRALLFLPSELVDAVILHELAHLRHPNHSPAFWSALEEMDPETASHRASIRCARDAVPAWAERR